MLGPLKESDQKIALRIFNPDGSEAEKSGNGLRIFARYLWDTGIIQYDPVEIRTSGGVISARVHSGGRIITVRMGRVSFDSRQIPVDGPAREVLNESLKVGGEEFRFCAASIGNPHCVILKKEISRGETLQFGPLIENEPRFPHHSRRGERA